MPTLLDEHDQRVLREVRTAISEQTRRLRDIVPCILDMSTREATLASRHGHTLSDKIELHRLACDFGFGDFMLPNFLDFPSVADQFIDYIVREDLDRSQFLATLAVEPTTDDGKLREHPTIDHMRDAAIPNLILLVEIRSSTIARAGRSQDQAMTDIARYVRHFRSNLPTQGARAGRIYVRIADLYDAFDEDPEFTARVLRMLGEAEITGILFEDVRGSRFVFETRELVKLIRHFNPPPLKILVHPHSGNGMEDAATIEAVLAGADGVWAGFTPQAAQGGHGSSMMFITNLVRAGNNHVRKAYELGKLLQVADGMWRIHDRDSIPANQPVVGQRAYRYVDQYFEQGDQPCDLDPASIGCQVGYQISPAWAPVYIISKRLCELGYGTDVTQDNELLHTMRVLMNQSQMEGKHVVFDDADELEALLRFARQRLVCSDAAAPEDDAAALTMRYR